MVWPLACRSDSVRIRKVWTPQGTPECGAVPAALAGLGHGLPVPPVLPRQRPDDCRPTPCLGPATRTSAGQQDPGRRAGGRTLHSCNLERCSEDSN